MKSLKPTTEYCRHLDVLDWVKDATGLDDGCPRESGTNPTPPPTPSPTTQPPVVIGGCSTVGGDDPNKECVFPFTFGGVTYNECTNQVC